MGPLVIERFVDAPLSRTWVLWTTADGLAEWWWSFLEGSTYAIDATVGGTYRIENGPAGFGVRGTFTAVEFEARLAGTWIWLDDGTDGIEEEIDVRFDAEGSGTRLTIWHHGPWTTSEPGEAYAQGWSDTLAHLYAAAAAD